MKVAVAFIMFIILDTFLNQLMEYYFIFCWQYVIISIKFLFQLFNEREIEICRPLFNKIIIVNGWLLLFYLFILLLLLLLFNDLGLFYPLIYTQLYEFCFKIRWFLYPNILSLW